MNKNSVDRRIIVKFLYQFNFSHLPLDEDGSVSTREINDLVDQFCLTLETESSVENLRFHIDSSKELIKKIIKVNELIEAAIIKNSHKGSLDKISKIDLTILKLGIYELFFRKEIPPKVVINEALLLANEFSGPKSSGFINGVLDTIYKELKD